jgi:polyisoprenoid-binding protein YceI
MAEAAKLALETETLNVVADAGYSNGEQAEQCIAHFIINRVTGYFREFDARVTCACPSDDFTGGTVDFAAKTASVFTDNKDRDGHLQTKSFFGSKQFPEMKFTGTLVKEDGRNKLKGLLTIRDVTRPVLSMSITEAGFANRDWPPKRLASG